MENPLKEIPSQQLTVMVVAAFVLTLLVSYLTVFKAPWQTYAGLRQSRLLMEGKANVGDNLDGEIRGLQQEVEGLSRQLYGEGAAIPSQRLIATNIDLLDRISARHQVRLESVQPAASQTVRLFTEVPLAIRVSGAYLDLYAWLHEVENELGPMVIKQFDLVPKGGGKELTMNLKMVTYVPLETPP